MLLGLRCVVLLLVRHLQRWRWLRFFGLLLAGWRLVFGLLLLGWRRFSAPLASVAWAMAVFSAAWRSLSALSTDSMLLMSPRGWFKVFDFCADDFYAPISGLLV